MNIFSFRRFWAVTVKEFVQMRRDRMTFAMMVGVPLLQLVLYGFAINYDPKTLPVAVLSADNSPFSRSIVSALENSNYFRLTQTLSSREQGQKMLRDAEVQFVITIPERFGAKLLRGERPVLLVEADATDPGGTSHATYTVSDIVLSALKHDLKGPLADLLPADSPVDVRLHEQYNPEIISQYSIIPGLIGVILTMTLVIITGMAITRERERGTMESLLSTPLRPLEVMLGKIVPYILFGYIQVVLILAASRYMFHVPEYGSLWLILGVSAFFIAANLAVGVTFSSIARNQLQAMQMSIFFFLPSILLSGFMFPFRGMPEWAQWLGEGLPLTHYLRFVRGVLLKGNGIEDSIAFIWPILVFLVAVLFIGLTRYRQRLD